MKEIKAILAQYEINKQPETQMAMATVIGVRGSSYRSPGAKMLIFDNGRWVGAVSGGCLEGDALRRAKKVMANQKPMQITYDTRKEDNGLGVGLGCKGVIDILIEPVSTSVLSRFYARAIQDRSIKKMLTIVGENEELLGCKALFENGALLESTSNAPSVVQLMQEAEKETKLNSGSIQGVFEFDGRKVHLFLELLVPTIQLIIFGGGQDVKPVTSMAKFLGWKVVVTDECVAHTAPVCFPDADIVKHSHHSAILDNFEYDSFTAVLLMSHNFDYDSAVLQELASLELRYCGIIGPKKRYKALLEEISEEHSLQLYSPVGIDIGSETPDEIALSITAEILAVFRNRPAGFLRQKTGPIHDRNQEYDAVHKTVFTLG